MSPKRDKISLWLGRTWAAASENTNATAVKKPMMVTALFLKYFLYFLLASYRKAFSSRERLSYPEALILSSIASISS